MTVLLAAYSLAVAALYALVWIANAAAANALVMFFVVAVLVPAVSHDWRKRRDRDA